MKRTIILLTLSLLIAGEVAAWNHCETTASGDLLYYTVQSGYAVLEGRSDSVTSAAPYISLVIPTYINVDGNRIPVRVIGKSAFRNDMRLIDVTIPQTVRVVRDSAFAECYCLGNLSVSSTVDSISSSAFVGVANVVYHGNATGGKWGARLVNGYTEDGYCYSDSTKRHLVYAPWTLTTFTVPPTVDTLGPYSFSTPLLDNVVVDDNMPELCGKVFYGNQHLKSVHYIRTTPLSAGALFYACTALSDLRFADNVTDIPDYAFNKCRSLKHVVIPDGVTAIRTLFSTCDSLETVHLGDGVRTIDNSAFANCHRLRAIRLGPNVETIGSFALYSCTSLASIVLPSKIRQMSMALYGCTGLESITSMSTNPGMLTLTDVTDVDTSITVYIPCGQTDNYMEKWSCFNHYEEIPYAIVATSEDSVKGTAAVVDAPECGATNAVVEATANEGYIFVRWSDGSTDNPLSINGGDGTVVELTAYFRSTNGIEQSASETTPKVVVRCDVIEIEECDTERVTIYDIQGRTLFSTPKGGGRVAVSVPTSGVYIVKVGERPARKCVVMKR